MTYNADVYTRARRDGSRAIDALRLARWIAADRLDVPLPGETPLTIERDGFTLTIRTQYDDGLTIQDIGYGTFEDGSQDWRTGYWHPNTPGAIPNPDAGDSRSVSDARFYVPNTPRSERIEYNRKRGMSRSVALDEARRDEREEVKAVLNHGYGPTVLGVIVKASRAGVTLGEASVWGVEIAWSDVTRTDGSEYLAEVAEELIPEAIADAEASLARLRGRD